MQVLVIDLETTGLLGDPVDKVVEVGLAKVDTRRRTVMPFFGTVIKAKLTKAQREESWIFSNGMTVSEVDESAISEERAKNIIRCLTRGQYLTSFNTGFDIERFLINWKLDFIRAPCLMRAADQVADIPRKYHDIGCYPSLDASYRALCPDDPCHNVKAHRAVNDAMMAGYVLLALKERGLYDPMHKGEYA